MIGKFSLPLPGVPNGWYPTRWGKPIRGEHFISYFDNRVVLWDNDGDSAGSVLIVERRLI